MKILIPAAVAFVLVATLALFVLQPALATGLTLGVFFIGLVILASLAGVYIWERIGKARLAHAEVELTKSQAWATSIEASKIKLDVYGLATKPGQGVSVTILPRPEVPALAATPAPVLQELPAGPDLATIPKMVDLLPALNQFKSTGLLNPARLDLLLGIGPGGSPVVIPLHDFMHGGGLGTTGSGKSSQQRSIITQMLLLAGPSNQRKINLFLFDLEGRELALFRSAGPTEFYTEDVLEAVEAIRELKQIVECNARLSEEAVQEEPYTLVAIEELLDFIGALPKAAREDLDFIMRRGRKSRVYVMGASQFFQVSQVGKALKSMMNSRMCFNSEQEDGQAFGFKPQTLKMLTEAKGRFAYRLNSEELGGLSGIAQAPFISAKTVKLVLEQPASPNTAQQVTTDRPTAYDRPIEAEYRVLPATELPTRLQKALEAFRTGADSVSKLAEALQCSTGSASGYLQSLERLGYIKRPSK